MKFKDGEAMHMSDIDDLEFPSTRFKGTAKDVRHRKKVMEQAQTWKSRAPMWKRQLSSLKGATKKRGDKTKR